MLWAQLAKCNGAMNIVAILAYSADLFGRTKIKFDVLVIC
jgi:hypothetical protein